MGMQDTDPSKISCEKWFVRRGFLEGETGRKRSGFTRRKVDKLYSFFVRLRAANRTKKSAFLPAEQADNGGLLWGS